MSRLAVTLAPIQRHMAIMRMMKMKNSNMKTLKLVEEDDRDTLTFDWDSLAELASGCIQEATESGGKTRMTDSDVKLSTKITSRTEYRWTRRGTGPVGVGRGHTILPEL